MGVEMGLGSYSHEKLAEDLDIEEMRVHLGLSLVDLAKIEKSPGFGWESVRALVKELKYDDELIASDKGMTAMNMHVNLGIGLGRIGKLNSAGENFGWAAVKSLVVKLQYQDKSVAEDKDISIFDMHDPKKLDIPVRRLAKIDRFQWADMKDLFRSTKYYSEAPWTWSRIVADTDIDISSLHLHFDFSLQRLAKTQKFGWPELGKLIKEQNYDEAKVAAEFSFAEMHNNLDYSVRSILEKTAYSWAEVRQANLPLESLIASGYGIGDLVNKDKANLSFRTLAESSSPKLGWKNVCDWARSEGVRLLAGGLSDIRLVELKSKCGVDSIKSMLPEAAEEQVPLIAEVKSLGVAVKEMHASYGFHLRALALSPGIGWKEIRENVAFEEIATDFETQFLIESVGFTYRQLIEYNRPDDS